MMKIFFKALLAVKIPTILVGLFQTIFKEIEVERGGSLSKKHLLEKLDAVSEATRQSLELKKKHNSVYANIDEIGCAELFIFSLIKPIIFEALPQEPLQDYLGLIQKLNGCMNRKNNAYLPFCEKYYTKICADNQKIEFNNIKSKIELDQDKDNLRKATGGTSLKASLYEKGEIVYSRLNNFFLGCYKN